MTKEFFQKYSYKIKTREELKELIGPFPREKKTIMCHGMFDVVHPGHVRHLAYAKSMADILIASITTDKHNKKGVYRPHVPQNIRALNLAAFEMVDYVLIDGEAKPLENLQYLQPDLFAKGFEYTGKGLPPATQEEADIVEGYGGQMIFTPGDVVYSSSNFIKMAEPNIGLEKLLSLMNTHDLTFNNLRDAVNNLGGRSVHVIGDTIIDSYTRTTLIGGQTKTPTFSVLYEDQDNYIGGAGIVAQHIRAAGANVVFSTVLGDDEFKDFTINGLENAGVTIKPIIDPTRPTTNKNAIIAGGYRLLKIDRLDNRSISEKVINQLVDDIKNVKCDGVVFSDFRHGIFNSHTVPILMEALSEMTYKVADSQVASRWGNITDFKNFNLITPNEREARFALADQDSTVSMLSTKLYEQTDCEMLILKMGPRGVFSCRNFPEDIPSNAFSIDTFTDKVLDAVGAGDALLSYATLAMMATNNEVIAAILGSMAAACECEYDGNIPIKPENVMKKIDAVEKMANYG